MGPARVRLAVSALAYTALALSVHVANPPAEAGGVVVFLIVAGGLVAGYVAGRARVIALCLVWLPVVLLPQRSTPETERDISLVGSLLLTLIVSVPIGAVTLACGYLLRRHRAPRAHETQEPRSNR